MISPLTTNHYKPGVSYADTVAHLTGGGRENANTPPPLWYFFWNVFQKTYAKRGPFGNVFQKTYAKRGPFGNVFQKTYAKRGPFGNVFQKRMQRGNPLEIFFKKRMQRGDPLEMFLWPPSNRVGRAIVLIYNAKCQKNSTYSSMWIPWLTMKMSPSQLRDVPVHTFLFSLVIDNFPCKKSARGRCSVKIANFYDICRNSMLTATLLVCYQIRESKSSQSVVQWYSALSTVLTPSATLGWFLKTPIFLSTFFGVDSVTPRSVFFATLFKKSRKSKLEIYKHVGFIFHREAGVGHRSRTR